MSGNLLNTNIALLGLNNLADSAVWRSGPVATNPVNGQLLSASNLANRKLSNIWRSTGITPDSCGFGGDITANQRSVGGVSIVGHNLNGFYQPLNGTALATGAWRYRGVGWNGAGNSLITRPRALAILTSTNLTGVVSAIQDPDTENEDSSWLTATNGSSNTSLRVSFQSPTGVNLATTAATFNTWGVLPFCQQFFVTLRRSATGSGTPSVAFTLYENGVSRGTILGGGSVASTAVTYVLNWSGASLSSNLDDGRVELQIDGTAVSGTTVEIGAVSWAREFTTGTGYILQDSGWVPIVLPTSYTNNPSIPGPPFTEVNFLTPQNIDSFWIDLIDVRNTAAYLQVGRLILSSVDTFQVGISYSWGLSWNDPSVGIRSTGSSAYVYRLQPWREFMGVLENASQVEAYGIILDKLDRGKGTSGDFLAIIHPDDPNFLWMRTIYARQSLLDGANNANAITTEEQGLLYKRKLLWEEIS